jgi:DNA-binding CsgD family transcriptional regulator
MRGRMPDELTDLIELVYDAALDDEALATLPERIARFVGGNSCVIQRHDADGSCELLSFNHFGAELAAEYTRHFADSDPWVHALTQNSNGTAINVDRYLSRAEYMSSFGYNEFARKNRLDMIHCIGAISPLPGQAIAGFAVHRGLRQSAFDAAEEQKLQALLPHIRRLLMLRARIAMADCKAETADGMFAQLPVAILLLQPDARVVYASAQAMALLACGDGLAWAPGGRIRAERQSDSEVLRAEIARASSRMSGGALQVRRSSGARALQLVVAPFMPRDAMTSRGALIVVVDPESQTAGLADILVALFGLSKGEARVAAGLAEGMTLPMIAEANGVKLSSVQTQLKRALEKTGARRQNDLIALVSRAPRLR